MSLELRHLRMVASIAEAKSVSRAANRLHLTQSALSHQLRDAEAVLGRPLFERRSRKMVLTFAGDQLLRSARQVLDEIDRIEMEIRHSSMNPETVLRISTECYTVYHWLPSKLKLFHQKYPDVEVQLVLEATTHPLEALLEETLDIAISWNPVRNRKIQYTRLFRDEMVVLVPPGHCWASRAFIQPEDFADEDLIIYPPKDESTVMLKILQPAGVAPRRIREIMLTEADPRGAREGGHRGSSISTMVSYTPDRVGGIASCEADPRRLLSGLERRAVEEQVSASLLECVHNVVDRASDVKVNHPRVK